MGGRYSLWAIRGGSARKGYLFLVFRLQVYEREGISLVELYARIGKSVIFSVRKAQKG